MRKVKLEDGSHFLIRKEKDFILVVASAFVNPLDYIYELGKEINVLSRDIKSNKVQVIVNLTPLFGNDDLVRVLKLNYLKNRKSFDLKSIKLFEK